MNQITSLMLVVGFSTYDAVRRGPDLRVLSEKREAPLFILEDCGPVVVWTTP